MASLSCPHCRADTVGVLGVTDGHRSVLIVCRACGMESTISFPPVHVDATNQRRPTP
jgi:transcription elongation factor Elf1